MLCLAEIVLDGSGSLFLPEHSLEFGIGVPIQGFFSQPFGYLSFDTLDDVFGFLSNAVPKACAAIPTMASSFFVRRTFVFLQV